MQAYKPSITSKKELQVIRVTCKRKGEEDVGFRPSVIAWQCLTVGAWQLLKTNWIQSHVEHNINTVAPVTSVERKRRQRLFRARDKSQQQPTSRQQLLRTVGYSYAAMSDL